MRVIRTVKVMIIVTVFICIIIVMVRLFLAVSLSNKQRFITSLFACRGTVQKCVRQKLSDQLIAMWLIAGQTSTVHVPSVRRRDFAAFCQGCVCHVYHQTSSLTPLLLPPTLSTPTEADREC